MYQFVQRVIAILLVVLANAASAELVIVEEAIEMQPLQVQLTSESSGLIYGKTCEDCKPIQLIVTETTKAFLAGKPLALTELKQYAKLGGTVFYDKASRTVTRIEIWR